MFLKDQELLLKGSPFINTNINTVAASSRSSFKKTLINKFDSMEINPPDNCQVTD